MAIPCFCIPYPNIFAAHFYIDLYVAFCAVLILSSLHVSTTVKFKLTISEQNDLSGSVKLLRTIKRREYPLCFFSRSGYRLFINLPPSLGNLLLDITLCSISFRCCFVFVNFTVTIRVRVSYRVKIRV